MGMTPSQKRFCVLTTGRTGSTALMNRLEKFDDVALPNKNVDCPDNELLRFDQVKNFAKQYSELCNITITTREQLINSFFEYNSGYAYAGFKTMPNRHKNYRRFIQRPDVKFIVLTRENIASTAASFMVAMKAGSWRRAGQHQRAQWTFRRSDVRPVMGNLAYIYKSNVQLSRVPNAIRLTYEELCDPGFHRPELDEFFDRPVRIDDPRPPTSGREYVTNWEVFEAFINKAYGEMQARTAAARKAG